MENAMSYMKFAVLFVFTLSTQLLAADIKPSEVDIPLQGDAVNGSMVHDGSETPVTDKIAIAFGDLENRAYTIWEKTFTTWNHITTRLGDKGVKQKLILLDIKEIIKAIESIKKPSHANTLLNLLKAYPNNLYGRLKECEDEDLQKAMTKLSQILTQDLLTHEAQYKNMVTRTLDKANRDAKIIFANFGKQLVDAKEQAEKLQKDLANQLDKDAASSREGITQRDQAVCDANCHAANPVTIEDLNNRVELNETLQKAQAQISALLDLFTKLTHEYDGAKAEINPEPQQQQE